MLPDESQTVIRNSASVLRRVLDALRPAPHIAEAVAHFSGAVRADGFGGDPAQTKASSAALASLLGTFQNALAFDDSYGCDVPEHADGTPGRTATVLREYYGFIPRLFQSQEQWSDLLSAEVCLLEATVFQDAAFSRAEKERILLGCAVANRDDYAVALQFAILKLLGEETKAIGILRNAGQGGDPLERLAWATSTRGTRSEAEQAFRELGACGLSEAQRIEGLAVCAVGNLLHSLQVELQPAADFALPDVPKKLLYPIAPEDRPTAEQPLRDDPDATIVAQVRTGDTEAFAQLIRSHTRRVFATLLGLLGDAEEARDVCQESFLKAFENLHRFEGRSKFSSWLMSIAINTGTEVLRRRRHFETIDGADDDEDWRPRQIQEWSDNPEECFAKEEMKELVRRGVMRLPSKYRVALLVRDVSQLSTEDAADALGLSVPALKARVLRGRLMLREALAPHFVSARERGAHG